MNSNELFINIYELELANVRRIIKAIWGYLYIYTQSSWALNLAWP